jgi:hypothetical protein
MTDFQIPDCQVFVDADTSERELIGLVAQFLFADGDSPGCEAKVARNDDYDSTRRKQFPGGFIYFRFTIDLYVDEDAQPRKIGLVANLLEGLWSWGFAAVAACDFEDRLPNNGGYKSTTVPWPE